MYVHLLIYFFLGRAHNSLQILKGVDDYKNVKIHNPIILENDSLSNM